MKKKRTIIIRDPLLQRIRNNLRSLIIEVSKSIQHKLSDEIESLTADVNEYFNNPELMIQNKNLVKKKQLLNRQVDASIVFCPVCFKADKNMTYNPVRKFWYCTECYEKLKKGYAEEGELKEFP
ncbi:MAG: hypothetical protein ACFFBI_14040 [Promethearchaeota archaeon]